MGNDVRKWLPVAVITATIAASAFLLRAAPATVAIDLRGLLPFAIESTSDTGPRWLAIAGIPLLALLVWAGFQLGRARAGLRIARALFPDVPDAVTDPATLDRFRATHDTIALWVVILILGIHAGIVAAALGHEALTPRLVSVIMGVSIAAMGNVVPRLRPNLVAGVRTQRTLSDPQLWRATHRILGFAIVAAGTITAIVGLAAPAYGLPTAVVTLVAACVVAAAGGVRGRGAIVAD